MNLVLLLPAALAALVALLLPLLLHLARRDERRLVDFAALRWLRQRPRPRRRIRLEEWPLLLLRLLLLGLLALWLARPAWSGAGAERHWIVLVPGVDASLAPVPAADEATTVRWLAPGFPPLDRVPPATPASIASLLRQLDAELPADAALTVYVPGQLYGADAQRPQLTREIQWRILPGAMEAAAPAPAPLPALEVRYAPDREPAMRYLRAAASAWQTPGEDGDGVSGEAKVDVFGAATAEQPVPADARHLVWLAPGELPAGTVEWIERGGIALLDAETRFDMPAEATAYWRDAAGAVLVEGAPLGRGRVLRFTRALAPASMPQLLEAEFPQRLHALFVPPAPPPTRVAAADYLPSAGAAAYPRPPRDLQPWLALLVALLFLAERLVATGHRQGRVP